MIRAVIDVEGPIELKRDALDRVRPIDPLVVEGEAALARALEAQVRPVEPGRADEGPGAVVRPGAAESFEPVAEPRARTIDDEARDLASSLPPATT